MKLKDKINADLKSAMKEGNKLKLQTIRSIRASIIEFEKSGSGKELNIEEELKLLTSAAKRRKDSIEQFRNAGREDLAEKEEQELLIIQTYLPKQLSVEELRIKINEIAEKIGANKKEDFSKLMPAVMKELKGMADGKIVREIVVEILEKG
ncbi:MAG TPA: GatB/YqeY domain-containing protein [Ignavibacteria bacterium]|nr:GatB/YqeY domain-containing protein [Ignavibacteria bacterium]